MPRPMKCKRCGRAIVSTSRKNTRGCQKGKTRDTPAVCTGRMHEITWEEYERDTEEER